MMKEERIEKRVSGTLASLNSRHINGLFAETPTDACLRILGLIPVDAVVGLGDSATIKQLGILDMLVERGTRVLNQFKMSDGNISSIDARKYRERILVEATICDVFLTGTNAITEDGRLVNVDRAGNRVAGMFWGHPISILVVGRNKIVRDLDEAFYRIRNIIAPNHNRVKSIELGGRKRNTPCVMKGSCTDCRSTDRSCNIFTIIEGKPYYTDVYVVIVNEDLGLGWDTSWPQSRITKILEKYKKFVSPGI